MRCSSEVAAAAFTPARRQARAVITPMSKYLIASRAAR